MKKYFLRPLKIEKAGEKKVKLSHDTRMRIIDMEKDNKLGARDMFFCLRPSKI